MQSEKVAYNEHWHSGRGDLKALCVAVQSATIKSFFFFIQLSRHCELQKVHFNVTDFSQTNMITLHYI